MSGPRIVVVGGGISGLAAAHRLSVLMRERGIEVRVTLLEERENLGGLVATVRDGDLVLEAGPDQLVTHKPAGIALCKRLGLERELIEIAGAPHVLHRGRPHPLPAGFALVAPTRLGPLFSSSLFSWRGKVRIALERFVPPQREVGDESLAAFITRRFGREQLERLVEPILGGIFTADVDRMSTEQVLPRHRAFEQQHGSVTRGLVRMQGGAAAGLVSLQGGLGSLVSRLATALDRVEIRVATPALRLDRDTVRGCFTLQLAGQPSIEAEHVILACPAHAAARLLVFDGELASLLGQLDYAGCATVYLLYPRHARRDGFRGSGFFVPRTAGHPLLACSYVNRKFPDRAPRGTILLRAFLGGVRHPEVVELSDERLIELTRQFVEGVLELGGEPLHARCFRHPRAMPQFEVGHRGRLAAIARRVEQQPGLGLCGAASGATGLPDCIESGERAAEATLARASAEFALSVSN